MNTNFIYRKVENGEEVPLPLLRQLTEEFFPDHQVIIDSILNQRGLHDWRIAIHPWNSWNYGHLYRGRGFLLTHLKLIILSVATRGQMVITLLHEITHYLNPEIHDEVLIEKMALASYNQWVCEGINRKIQWGKWSEVEPIVKGGHQLERDII